MEVKERQTESARKAHTREREREKERDGRERDLLNCWVESRIEARTAEREKGK